MHRLDRVQLMACCDGDRRPLSRSVPSGRRDVACGRSTTSLAPAPALAQEGGEFEPDHTGQAQQGCRAA